jgi:mono/diheme cytochrome c family protein
MKHLRRIILGVLFAAALPLLGQTNRPQPPTKRPLARNTAHAANADRGQQVFDQNCSRCHNAPDGFSPRIAGTVAMHMRVRANLSKADYKALLRFLNP